MRKAKRGGSAFFLFLIYNYQYTKRTQIPMPTIFWAEVTVGIEDKKDFDGNGA